MLRDYEVSIWTLLDGFISILKRFNIEQKGQLELPKMILKDDGTEEFTFSIPMYLYQRVDDETIKLTNPLWHNVINGNIVAGLRKIKVIFDKHGTDEKVFEFVILKVTERHEEEQLFCDVECEGLAFHELGKIGYKISLSQELFELDYQQWAENTTESAPEPIANLQYWNNLIIKLMGWDIINTKAYIPWTFEIDMDHSMELGLGLDSDKIYEEPYNGSWEPNNDGNKLIPTSYIENKEKARTSIDISENNIYNITQELAETFGVFCRYEYIHDSAYRIIGKKIIYYNNFINEYSIIDESHELSNVLDITYPYMTSSITREMDSTDTITKMYVQSVDDSSVLDGPITIIDVPANRSREDYLLNFDYLYSIGAINQEQYEEIEIFETKMRILNNAIDDLDSKIQALQNELPKLNAELETTKEGINLAQEQINNNNDLLKSLTNNTGYIVLDSQTCDKPYVSVDNSNKSAKNYMAKLSKEGVVEKAYIEGKTSPVKVQAYETYDWGAKNPLVETNLIKGYTLIKDEHNFVTGITNLPSSLKNSLIYITYAYQPRLYYLTLIDDYEKKIERYQDQVNLLDTKINQYNNKIEEYTTNKNEALEQKRKLNAQFELMMGPALREGYWNPEDYDDYGNNYHTTISINNSSAISTGDNLVDFIWDNLLFDEELKGFYILGVSEDIVNYPAAIINTDMQDFLKDHISDATLTFKDLDYLDNSNDSLIDLTFLTIGSLLQYAYVKNNDNYIPVLLVTGAETLSDDSINKMQASNESQLGIYGYENNEFLCKDGPVNIGTWLTTETPLQLYYPRIRVRSSKLKTDSSNLIIKVINSNGELTLLKEFLDYYTFSRLDTVDQASENNYYITIYPHVLISAGTDAQLEIHYTLSNADISIYLDAILVLKENSLPKVSYTVSINSINPKSWTQILQEQLIKILYKVLGRIVNINDTDLKFKNVLGYISEVNLDLDLPLNDEITIQNYKTKFEDLFTSIVASTEAMQKNAAVITAASTALTTTGKINEDVIRESINNVDLNLAFNHGALTIDPINGIWGTSENGVVAIRGGGIFTATLKNDDGDWIWNTGILPSGINADLITTGQLDTNLIRIFAGNELRFLWNGEGLFAYKNILEDLNSSTENIESVKQALLSLDHDLAIKDAVESNGGIDYNQFVRIDGNGLALIAKQGAYLLEYVLIENPEYDATNPTPENPEYITQPRYVTKDENNVDLLPEEGIKRVEVSWDGFILRNWSNEKVFWADPDSGNLTLNGILSISGKKFNIEAQNNEDDYANESYIYFAQPTEKIIEIFGDIRNNGTELIDTDTENGNNDGENENNDGETEDTANIYLSVLQELSPTLIDADKIIVPSLYTLNLYGSAIRTYNIDNNAHDVTDFTYINGGNIESVNGTFLTLTVEDLIVNGQMTGLNNIYFTTADPDPNTTAGKKIILQHRGHMWIKYNATTIDDPKQKETTTVTTSSYSKTATKDWKGVNATQGNSANWLYYDKNSANNSHTARATSFATIVPSNSSNTEYTNIKYNGSFILSIYNMSSEKALNTIIKVTVTGVNNTSYSKSFTVNSLNGWGVVTKTLTFSTLAAPIDGTYYNVTIANASTNADGGGRGYIYIRSSSSYPVQLTVTATATKKVTTTTTETVPSTTGYVHEINKIYYIEP